MSGDAEEKALSELGYAELVTAALISYFAVQDHPDDQAAKRKYEAAMAELSQRHIMTPMVTHPVECRARLECRAVDGEAVLAAVTSDRRNDELALAVKLDGLWYEVAARGVQVALNDLWEEADD